MLLPPLLAVLVVVVARDRRRALGHAAALLAASFLVVAPITLRNYVVFGEWVPVSINGGLTLWQGVADAGGEAVGAFRRDKLVMDEEAVRYGNPRYREWWAEPDGIFRDRERYRRAREVIRAHPLLYARVVAGRALEMLSYHTAAGPPTLGGETAAVELLERTQDDDADDARAHDLARRPADDRFLAPGRASGPLRKGLGLIQALLLPALTTLALLGALVLLLVCWRSASGAAEPAPVLPLDGELLPVRVARGRAHALRDDGLRGRSPRHWPWRRCDAPSGARLRTRPDSRSRDTTPCRAG